MEIDAGLCMGCQEPILLDEPIELVPIGPGADPEQRRKAAAHVSYTAVAIPCHRACVTGVEA